MVVPVEPPSDSCPRCSGPTSVLKSATRHIVTLAHGAFVAREVIRACSSGCRDPRGRRSLPRSQVLARHVAPGAVYGYDLEVHVGLQKYLHHRQRKEILQGLAEKQGISQLSTGEESVLAARFIEHLEALHCKRAPQLAAAMRQDGGYPLHIDATGEDGRGTTFLAYNGWRDWVLGAWKLSTERSELALPRLRRVPQDFGQPCAIVRDLGRAMILVADQLVGELDRDIPILSCHQHFLADVGSDLMEAPYDDLRELIRLHGLRAQLRALTRDLSRRLGAELPGLRKEVEAWALSATGHALPAGSTGVAAVRFAAQWVLDYPRDADGLGFPFDRPYLDFYRRCLRVRRATDAFLPKAAEDARTRRALTRLAGALDPVIRDGAFRDLAARLTRRAALFDELRQALRLNPHGSPRRTSWTPQQAAAELQDIRAEVGRLKRSLRHRRPQRGPAEDVRQAIDVVLNHLKRHGGSLWGHAIRLPRRVGGGIRLVDRTNNALEGVFRVIKHGERRRSGRKVLTHDFEQLPAGAALVCNLTRPDYARILCGSLDRLPEAFAKLDAAERVHSPVTRTSKGRHGMEHEVLSKSISYEDRALIRGAALHARILAAAQSRAPYVAISPG